MFSFDNNNVWTFFLLNRYDDIFARILFVAEAKRAVIIILKRAPLSHLCTGKYKHAMTELFTVTQTSELNVELTFSKNCDPLFSLMRPLLASLWVLCTLVYEILVRTLITNHTGEQKNFTVLNLLFHWSRLICIQGVH